MKKLIFLQTCPTVSGIYLVITGNNKQMPTDFDWVAVIASLHSELLRFCLILSMCAAPLLTVLALLISLFTPSG